MAVCLCPPGLVECGKTPNVETVGLVRLCRITVRSLGMPYLQLLKLLTSFHGRRRTRPVRRVPDSIDAPAGCASSVLWLRQMAETMGLVRLCRIAARSPSVPHLRSLRRTSFASLLAARVVVLWLRQMAETMGLVRVCAASLRDHLRCPIFASLRRTSFASQLAARVVCFGCAKWRRRWDSNPWNPFEAHFFSKEALSATQPRLHTRNRRAKRSAIQDQP